jgi:hypothetical protein
MCFDTSKVFIKCPSCSCICIDCMKEYIKNCSKETNVIPICLNCNNYFLYSSIPDELLDSYIALFNDNEILINKLLINKLLIIIKKTRTSRFQLLLKGPDAIKTTIEIALKKKLESVYKNNLKALESKKCMTNFCTGLLEYDHECYKCSDCKNSFCFTCHERLTRGYHICYSYLDSNFMNKLNDIKKNYTNKDLLILFNKIESLYPKNKPTLTETNIAKNIEKKIQHRNLLKQFYDSVIELEKKHITNKINLHLLRTIYSKLHNATGSSISALTNFLYYIYSLQANDFPNEIVYPKNIKLKIMSMASDDDDTTIIPISRYISTVNNTLTFITDWLIDDNKQLVPLNNDEFEKITCSETYIIHSRIQNNSFDYLKDIHGSFYVFYVTKPRNWFSILKNGIKIFSSSNRIMDDSMYGTGICCSKNLKSLNYEDSENIFAICELINDKTKVRYINQQDVYIIKDDNIIVPRYLFVSVSISQDLNINTEYLRL